LSALAVAVANTLAQFVIANVKIFLPPFFCHAALGLFPACR